MKTVTIKVDQSGALVCDPASQKDVDRNERVIWVTEDNSPIEDWVVFFAKGAPVDPLISSSLPAHAEQVKVDKYAVGRRGQNDPLEIKYCVAATVNGKLKECDPELIVKPG